MLFLGLFLLTATGAFTALAVAGNLSGGPEYTVTVLGQDIATMNGLALFCSGFALALIFCLGLAMTTAGAMHRHRRSFRARHRRGRTPLDDTRGRPGGHT
ncbi:hypothetical protein JS756_05735 [Streptomyces actuosus]|uniref:Uncharacterized protein n=1 Tax=Streptomyces actuosus TaxID=1885 RepID=A0ABS2VKI5_STRAS|nr:hypothetical protein [Streptomyces actuosus]MBN0043612.1 hypothetical protein [Streptomyces actuosus]